jgi:transposase-like protein
LNFLEEQLDQRLRAASLVSSGGKHGLPAHFGRDFKLVGVRLIKERGVSVAQAARDLDVHENVRRNWVKEFPCNPVQGLSREWADEARATRDRATSPVHSASSCPARFGA